MQSNRVVSVLALSCGGLFALYIALIATTVYFATWQTTLASDVNEAETRIALLETKYYEVIGTFDSSDAIAFGLVTPHVVEYAVSAGASSLSFASR